MNIKKALLLSGLVFTAGTVLANPKNEGLQAELKKEKEQKEEFEFFPHNENFEKAAYYRRVLDDFGGYVLDPGENENYQTIRKFFIHRCADEEEEKKVMKAFATIFEELWKEFKKEFKNKKNPFKSITKEDHIKICQQVVFNGLLDYMICSLNSWERAAKKINE